MAGFGSISLVQTAIGTLLDQRAVVLYKQPVEDSANKKTLVGTIINNLVGSALKYEELFAGLAGKLDNNTLTRLANISGKNPYGITYMEAKVNVESDLCDHPIETGAVVTDASIVLPVKAEVTVVMPTFFAERIYEQMYDLYKMKKDKIILQTKYGIYKNLVLQNIEYELEHDTIDRTRFILTLREIQEYAVFDYFDKIAKEVEKIKEASDATTVNGGTQMAVEA